MAQLGLPVPPGFTISTQACRDAQKNGGKMSPELREEVLAAVARLEERSQRRLGDPERPLLLSVRSGAKFSMPGMMDTVLNLGINSAVQKSMAQATGDARFAADCHRRFLAMFGHVVLGVPGEAFEKALDRRRTGDGATNDAAMSANALERVVSDFQAIIVAHTGDPAPTDPYEQLWAAIEAVFASWMNPRAVTYRKLNDIPDDLGTAVNVQRMVFGDAGDDSATGVAFTRNPATGERGIFGEFLINAQGEDIVSGSRTPLPMREFAEQFKPAWEDLRRTAAQLEKHFKDMLDLEFTVEQNKLWMLQTRTGKRTVAAAVRIAVDLVEDGIIDWHTALKRIEPASLSQLLHPTIDAKVEAKPVTTGLAASPGAAAGEIVFTADAAAEAGHERPIILVRPETTPDDIHGMAAATGILTARGGLTSHAAVVARGMGKPCVAGATELVVDLKHGRMTVGKHVFHEGDRVTIDGSTGRVYAGLLPTTEARPPAELSRLLAEADRVRRLGVKANADTPEDARRAVELGAEGIGLCRTEHMFFGPDRLPHVQRAISAESDQVRDSAIAALLPMQREDFEGIFEALGGRPVTIRLIDPPLHEFLPSLATCAEQVARLEERHTGGKPLDDARKLLATAQRLHEQNPMLGMRGVRLGVVIPSFVRMQARAMAEAAVATVQRGVSVDLEVMVPLVAFASELALMREQVVETMDAVIHAAGVEVTYCVGTMIELPRACLVAGEIARHADFFSFGTNDLTQTTLGFSRDDAEHSFLPAYLERGLIPFDPFKTLDADGVGELMRIAVERGRATNPSLQIGICGEHGGDPASIELAGKLGLDYVSCSPFRVPVARLAAAQEAVGTLVHDR
jgi:pyruvate,orthophosphate dikinase